jgi:hypothetical protein
MTESNSLNELISLYPYGSMYVTYIPLHDLKHLLNDARKLPLIMKATSQPDSLETFAAFLNTHAVGSLKDGIAFLHLDLNNLKASFKRISDLDAVPRTLTWRAREVQAVAELCDVYINKLPTFEQAHVSIRSGQISLHKAWQAINELLEDPFITASRVADLVGNFKGLVDEKPMELEALKFLDSRAYQSIKSVTNDYDTYLSNLVTRQPSANLLKNQLVLITSNEEFEKARREGDALSCMKDSAGFLRKFGVNVSDLPASEMFEVGSFLNAPLIKKRRLSSGEGLDFSSIDSDLLGGKGGFGEGGFGEGGIGGGAL